MPSHIFYCCYYFWCFCCYFDSAKDDTEIYIFSHIANELKSIDIIMWHTHTNTHAFFPFFPFVFPFNVSLSGSVGCRLLDLHISQFIRIGDVICSVHELFPWSANALYPTAHTHTAHTQPSSSIWKERISGGKALWKYNLSLVTHKFWTHIMLLYRV